MNQILKDTVYGKGTPRQLSFIAELGGMNEEETKLFYLLHERASDIMIESAMNIDRKTRMRIEEAVRAKVAIAIFHCIDITYEFEERTK